ncbi:MAG: permease-like cell division protein FtsX [Baekduia sp.]
MRPTFFIKEAFRSISRNAIPSFAAMASVLVTVLVIGVFIPVVQATTGAANDVRERLIVNVYLKKSAKQADVERVNQLLQSRVDHVDKVKFISKDEAYAEQKKLNPEAYELLGSNPLPDTFRITPDDPDNIQKILDQIQPRGVAGGVLPIDSSIDEAVSGKKEKDKILKITSFVKIAMGLLTTLLVIASILLISNTIRLSLFARRREVEVMKLVGATDSFIRWPFVLEGIALGALGGLGAIALLGVAKIALIDPLASDFALISAPQTIGFAALAVLLLGASVLVSGLGSSLSLRRFLRV